MMPCADDLTPMGRRPSHYVGREDVRSEIEVAGLGTELRLTLEIDVRQNESTENGGDRRGDECAGIHLFMGLLIR